MNVIELINKLPDPIKKFATTLYGNYVPLYDSTERRYYEIAYGLLASDAENRFGYEGIKNYVEHHLGEKCDEAKLKNALENFDSWHYDEASTYQFCDENGVNSKAGSIGFTAPKVKKLIEINRQLDRTPAYRCSEAEILDICYKEMIENLKKDFDQTIVDATVTKKWAAVAYNAGSSFYYGIKELTETYDKQIGKKFTQEYIHRYAIDNFFKNNDNFKKIMFESFYEVLHDKQSMHLVASLVLRALHFDGYKGKAEDYTSISEEECRDLVSNYYAYAQNVAKAENREEKAQQYVAKIKDARLFVRYTRNIWMPDQETEAYYTDAVCHYYWKQVASEYEDGDTTVPGEICDIIWDSIALSEEEVQEREKEARESERRFEERMNRISRESEETSQRTVYAGERATDKSDSLKEQQQREREEADRKRDEERQLQKEFYVLYSDKDGIHRGYVNSYRKAHIKSLAEVEKYWSDHFNPRVYNLTFVKATESRLEYEQWTR